MIAVKNIFSGLCALLLLAAPAMPLRAQTNDGKLHHPLPKPANTNLPSLFLIGDSTVRNGQGKGDGGQWGWGDFLAPYFDTNRINVVNRALGGTSSRTYYRDIWPGTLALMKPGDFVIMQFGHNDNGPLNDTTRARGTIKGVSDETREITNDITQQPEVVHSFGWYEKQIIIEARAHGVTPMICSLIPRNNWKNGKAVRNKNDYGGWAGQAAAASQAPFLDINEIIASVYDHMGQENVKPLFIVGAGPHTSMAGAETNALCVVSALKGLKVNPVAGYFTDKATGVPAADLSLSEPKSSESTPDKTGAEKP